MTFTTQKMEGNIDTLGSVFEIPTAQVLEAAQDGSDAFGKGTLMRIESESDDILE